MQEQTATIRSNPPKNPHRPSPNKTPLLRRLSFPINTSSPPPLAGEMGGVRGFLLRESRFLLRPNSYFQQLRAFDRTRHALPKAKDAAAVCSPSSSVGKGFVGWYLGMIEYRPVLTKSLTAGFIFASADLSAQVIVKSSDSFDLIRTARMAGYGMLISGPSLHLWFNFLSRHFPKTDMVTTLKKMILGQTTYGPFITTVFFSQNAALQGENASEILARLKRDLVPTLINGLVYWPMCDFITFKFVPVRLQPLVSNSFSFLWTIYLTYMASLKKADTSKIATD